MSKRLLFVFAHPDDESFAAGGTMAKAHKQGHEVFLICVTSGCKGRSGEFQFNSREQLAMHREEELRMACTILGVTDLILYRYPDGSLKDQDPDKLAERISQTIIALKPDVILSFPLDGVTGHPDHIAVSHAAEKAVILSEPYYSPARLPKFYYISVPHYYDHCQDAGPKDTCMITGKVDISEYRLLKGQALQAYKSQVYSVNRAYPGVMQNDFTVIGAYEYYTLIRADGKQVDLVAEKFSNELPLIDLVDKSSF
ncbi:PIG-L deacetylase family protein [Paenibacillus sp. GCM10023248]|uniref:PIG-L deacetylase family protein n=1 Tax=unclassified Paenibacillus TaxID=185978 RepID=UPI002378E351|nr:PIG-L deacetylase family protein [Paenibacillus sp. MAHUQ-63]MDD9265833.1 PIG-L family deacetylase [Paenibacillus sp. MAHUQ-63]